MISVLRAMIFTMVTVMLLVACLGCNKGDGGISDGGIQAASQPLCDGVGCWSPPGRSCLEGDCLKVYNPGGWCEKGECHYAAREEDCAIGTCEEGICIVTPCQGASCHEPPASHCIDAETLVIFNPVGYCASPGGLPECRYSSKNVTCENGCVDGRCIDDVCLYKTCSKPPARYCDGSNLVIFDTLGKCDQGNCLYNNQIVSCRDSCADGHCIETDPCGAVTCNVQPASHCIGPNALRAHEGTGTCADGACSYEHQDIVCENGCADGQCVGDKCAGVRCEIPVARYCKDDVTLVFWDRENSACREGACDFTNHEATCEFGCTSGSCAQDSCSGVICVTPPSSYCSSNKILTTFEAVGSCMDGICEYESVGTTCNEICIAGKCGTDSDKAAGEEDTCSHECAELGESCAADGITLETCTEDGNGCRVLSTKGCASGWCAGGECITVVIGAEWVMLPAGSFWMGSPSGCPGPEGYPGTCESELGRQTDEPLHYVELTGSFEMMRTEVTQGQWFTAFGNNPSYFGPNGSGESCGVNCPVELVNWYEVLAYANWLSVEEGLTPCYVLEGCTGTLGSGSYTCTVSLNGVSTPYECEGYRLPTEAEWEYAARSGTDTAFYKGEITSTSGNNPNLNLIGWYHDHPEYDIGTHEVGGLAANAWGLYDMSGNVNEWVWDSYGSYPAGSEATPLVDPTGSSSASGRVRRGGEWNLIAQYCRSADRNYNSPGSRYGGVGFRLSRSL